MWKNCRRVTLASIAVWCITNNIVFNDTSTDSNNCTCNINIVNIVNVDNNCNDNERGNAVDDDEDERR